MLQVTNSDGRKFNVRVVAKGDSYGLDDCLTHDQVDPLVEFYDASYANVGEFSERGQFTSRYYFTTLVKAINEHKAGITLHGDIPEWNINKENLRDVMNYAADTWHQKTQTYL
jgi:hypothetical protein